MTAVAYFHPLREAERISFDFTPGMSLAAIVKRAVATIEAEKGEPGSWEWFERHATVRVDGRVYDRDIWPMVRPKPGRHVDLMVTVQGGKTGKIALLLATVALTVATGFIAGGGLVKLGASAALFGAGTVGSTGAAALVGLGGALLIQRLTPSPEMPEPAGASRELSAAGISGNLLTPGEYLMSVIGRMRVSPQIVVKPYTTLKDEKVNVHAMLALAGDYEVSDIRVDGLAIQNIEGARWEVKEGDGAAGDTYLSQSFKIQKQLRMAVENFKTEDPENIAQNLLDQVTPTNSYSPTFDLPPKHADAKGFTIRHVFPNGIIVEDGTQAKRGGVAVRYQTRRVGDSTWEDLLVLHFESKKTFGPFQQDVSFVFGEPPGGYNIAINYESHTKFAFSKTGVGQSFSYESDPYFFSDIASPPSIYTDFTTYTNGTMTVSASSEKVGSEAWRAFNGSGALGWSPANNSLPAWLQIDFGVGQARTLRSFGLNYANILTAVKSCRIEGRLLPGDPWTVLFDSENRLIYGPKDVLPPTANGVPSKIMPCRQIRLVVTQNNGAANNEVLLADFFMSETFANPSAIDASGNFTTASGLAGTAIAARHVYLTRDGATVFLRPEQWPDGQYEFRIRRGWAYNADKFNAGYVYDGAPGNASFFTHIFTGGFNRTYENQKKIRSDLEVSMISEDYGFRAIRQDVEHRLTRIAVSIPGLEIQSISALFNGKARCWNAVTQSWDDTPTPTRNPFAYYRDALLRAEKNFKPLPGENIEPGNLEEAFEWAEQNGFTCDSVIHNRLVQDVLRLLASAARSSPRQANMWGVVIDRDRSAEPVTGMITPETSRNLKCRINNKSVPHAYSVTFFDETNDYKQSEITVYRDGYDATSATDIETRDDRANTSATAVAATALYDLRSLYHRNRSYNYEVGFEGRMYRRGDILKVVDETWEDDSYYGLIDQIRTSGGNVIGFKIYGVAELSKSVGQITMNGDTTFRIAVRQRTGGVFYADIVETSDTSVLTLVTPVADIGQFKVGRTISVGPATRTDKRMIINSKQRSGEERWILSLLPEAPEIFE